MFAEVSAHAFLRRMSNGKTKPSLVVAADIDGEDVQLIAKFSGGCEAGCAALCIEAITSMLAIELDLLAPCPYLVRFEPDIIDAINDVEVKAIAMRSSPLAFGSQFLYPGFSVSTPQTAIDLLPQAADILFFDCLSENPDRHVANPNCLTNGRDIAVIDHELCFDAPLFSFLPKPWERGGADILSNPEKQHVFFEPVRKRLINFDRIVNKFASLTDARINEFCRALPKEWLENPSRLDYAVSRIKEIRQNLPALANEVLRVLS